MGVGDDVTVLLMSLFNRVKKNMLKKKSESAARSGMRAKKGANNIWCVPPKVPTEVRKKPTEVGKIDQVGKKPTE
jgi:hypothetical protein